MAAAGGVAGVPAARVRLELRQSGEFPGGGQARTFVADPTDSLRRHQLKKALILAVLATFALAVVPSPANAAYSTAKLTKLVKSMTKAQKKQAALIKRQTAQINRQSRALAGLSTCLEYKVAGLGHNFGPRTAYPSLGYFVTDSGMTSGYLSSALDYSTSPDFYAAAVNPACVRGNSRTASIAGMRLPLIAMQAPTFLASTRNLPR